MPVIKRLDEMTDQERQLYMNQLVAECKKFKTPDTIGAVFVLFRENGQASYGGDLDANLAAPILRGLAEAIEQGAVVPILGQSGDCEQSSIIIP